MIKDRLKDLGTHPVFVSFIFWVFIILLIPSFFSKYRVKNIGEEYTDPKSMQFFYDLDSDNQSEKISLDLNDAGQTKIIVSRNNKIFDEYNLKYQSANNNSFFTGDYNHDGFKECYVFTCSQDSIFINIIDPVRLRKVIVKNRFVDFRRKILQSGDQPYIEKVGMIEGLSKNHYDLVFFISTGFSKQPRNVYRYMIAEDSIIKSPESAVVVAGCRIADINNDSLPELLLDVNAAGNFDEGFPFTDQYSWLMVLNKNLKFIFPPVQLGKYPSRLMVLPLKLKSRWRLVLFHDYFGTENIRSAFYLYDSKGNKLSEKPIEDYESLYSSILVYSDENQETFYFLKNRKGEIYFLIRGYFCTQLVRISQFLNRAA